MIKNKAVINEDSNGTIQLMKNEIKRLIKDLADSENRAVTLGQQCAFCRNNIGNELNTGTGAQYDEDEDLLSESFNLMASDEHPGLCLENSFHL